MAHKFSSVRTWITDLFRGKGRLAPHEQRHIIFDMDETLVHSFDSLRSLKELGLYSNPRAFLLRRRVYYLDSGIWGITRPHLESMLRGAFEAFSTVTVWSAGEATYVNDVIRRIFRGLPKPDMIMTRDDCETELIFGPTIDADGEEVYKKPLSVAREYYRRLGNGVVMTEANTLIVEDRPSAIAFEDRFNSILVPPYAPEPTLEEISREDSTLKTLGTWFAGDAFRRSSDLRSLVRPVMYSAPVPRGVVKSEYVIGRPAVLAGW